MYCGQCGKKVMENMLFCPFCGSPIVIPDQDEAVVSAPVAESTPAVETPAADPVSAAEPARSAPMEAPAEPLAPATAAKPAPAPAAQASRPVSLFEVYEAEQAAAAPRKNVLRKPEPEPERPAPETIEPVRKEDFVPLSFDFEDYGEAEAAPAAPRTEPVTEDLPVDELGPELFDAEGFADEPSEPAPTQRKAEFVVGRDAGAQKKRQANTYVPVKDVDPNDMFMSFDDDEYDADDYDDEDDYDGYDDDYKETPKGRGYYHDDDDFDFEEPEHGSFFQRHIRGIVGLILLLVLLTVCAVWAFSPNGQKTLARFNLAWTAKPYADLGYEAYLADQDEQAASYYEKAFARDDDNYDYAHSAMVAHYEAYDIEASAAMLKKCIELQPDNPEPYIEMLILYPDPETRPWEIRELIRLGYQRTGDESLKQ